MGVRYRICRALAQFRSFVSIDSHVSPKRSSLISSWADTRRACPRLPELSYGLKQETSLGRMSNTAAVPSQDCLEHPNVLRQSLIAECSHDTNPTYTTLAHSVESAC
jgi:hypothetical protein